MFALVRRCAEPITQACRLKVKVTVKGHEFEPWISSSLHISWTLWKIFIKVGSNVRLSEMMCRTHNSTMQTQGQGHNWRPPVWALKFEAAPLSFCGGGYSCSSDCLVFTYFQMKNYVLVENRTTYWSGCTSYLELSKFWQFTRVRWGKTPILRNHAYINLRSEFILENILYLYNVYTDHLKYGN